VCKGFNLLAEKQEHHKLFRCGLAFNPSWLLLQGEHHQGPFISILEQMAPGFITALVALTFKKFRIRHTQGTTDRPISGPARRQACS
jgi:hypothetical protein